MLISYAMILLNWRNGDDGNCYGCSNGLLPKEIKFRCRELGETVATYQVERCWENVDAFPMRLGFATCAISFISQSFRVVSVDSIVILYVLRAVGAPV